MKSTQIIDLQNFTILPLTTINVSDKALPDVIITTPHEGNVCIKLKEEHYPFLFGSVTQTDKHAVEIISQIRSLEIEACKFLVNEWIKNTK